jgi:hypothetical protein
MPVATREIRAFEGPNVYYPQAAVKLQVWADRDISREISDTLKNWAQVTGMVIGYLRQYTDPVPDGVLITTTWTTPLPTVGAQIAQQVVADIDAAERNDEDYDHDDALMAIIGERKRQEPSMALLQLLAEAYAHDVPVLRRADGHLVVGTGARSWSFDPAGLSLGLGVEVPWDSVGTVPLVAVTGPDAAAVTRLIAAFAQRAGRRVGCADEHGIVIAGEQMSDAPSADWDGVRRVLTDARVDVAIAAVSLQSIHERGLGFDTCRVGVVTGVDGVDPSLADAHGIVVLATAPDGTVVLNADAPAVLALRDWSAAQLVLYSEQELPVEPDETTTIVRLLDNVVRVSSTEDSTDVPRRPDTPTEHLLPVLAAMHALGIDIAM